jgi:hypothetical protein
MQRRVGFLPHAQRGAATIAITFLVLLLIGAALATLFGQTGSSVADATMAEQQAQALFIAEAGVSRAVRVYGHDTSTSACANLSTSSPGPYSFGAGTFSFNSSTSFTETTSDNKYFAYAKCRVRITGKAGNVSRVIEANLLKSSTGFPPAANMDFNQPSGTCNAPGCTPTNWNFNVLSNAVNTQAWTDSGGKTSTRGLYLRKQNGPTTGTAAGGYNFDPPITRLGGSTLHLDFDYKNVIGGGANKMSLVFTLYEKAVPAKSGRRWTTTVFYSGNTSGNWMRSGTSGAPASPSVTLNNTLLNEKIYINAVDFTLSLDSGNDYETWLDNIQIDGEETSFTSEERALVTEWREVVQ